MKVFTLAIVAAAAVASAASVPSVPPELAVIGEPSEILATAFKPSSGQTVLVRPGQTLNATDTKNAPQPQLKLMDHLITGDTQYLFMMVDPDINATNPTYVGLHTAVAGLSLHNETSSRTVAEYIAPTPPSPHNYTLLLFKQPDNLRIPSHFDSYFVFNAQNVFNRVNFPLQEFIAQTGLGKPIAGNWFQEGPSNTTSATPTTSNTTNSSTPSSTSAAGLVGRPHGLTFALIFVGAVGAWV